MNYDHNKKFGLFKFQSGYRKLYLNSPKGYSRKIINAQTAQNTYLTIIPPYLKVGEGRHAVLLLTVVWFDVHQPDKAAA